MNMDWIQAFYYQLKDTELSIVKSETDLGVTVTSTLNYNEHSPGLLRRALHFVSDQKQKRAFYFAIILWGVCLNIVVLSGAQPPNENQ